MTLHPTGRRAALLAPLLAALFACLALVALPAQGAFHVFRISEVYSNADGTLQFWGL